MGRQNLKCNKCSYINSEKEYRVFHIYINSKTGEEVLCDLCFKKSKREDEKKKEKRRRSKVPIV